ncbi:unnamed protein product, partial [Symbiodinium microadriaticum]
AAASSVKRPRGSGGAEACDLRLDDPSHEKELPSSSSTALGSSASSTSQEEKEPTFDGLRRTDLIRLIGQALGDLGLEVTRAALETESGIAGEASIVTDLRRSAIAGNWDEALGVVCRLAEEPPSTVGEAAAALRVSLLEQKCLDLHRSGEVEAAKEVFAEIAGTDGAEDLSQQLDLSPQELADSSPSRGDVADRLVELLPPDLALPPRRLCALLWQAVRYQQLHCLYTDLDPNLMYQQLHCLSTDMDPTLLSSGPNLLKDYSYTAPALPIHCVARLNHHRDEVWFAVVTDDGRYLASSSKDESIIVWECTAGPSFSVTEVLIGHSAPCAALAWSPDGRRLLSASSDGTVRLWTLPGAVEPEIFARHTDSVSAVAWLPDGEHFLSAGFDRCLLLWKSDGDLQHRWELQCRVQDLATTRDGSRVLVVDSDKGIKVFDVASGGKELAPLPESDAVTSISASRLRDEFLVNVAQHVSALQQGPSVRLWDLQTRRVAQRYVGHFQGRFVVRSAFVGEREELVASGSEDAQVYIWHRHYGSLLQVLPGHTATVNSVCWMQGSSPAGEPSGWLVSASDDCTLRVWGTEAAEMDEAESAEEEPAAAVSGAEDVDQRHGAEDPERPGFAASFHLEALEGSDVSS